MNIQDTSKLKRHRYPGRVSEAWREAHPQLEQRHKERRKHQDRNEITAVLRFLNWNELEQVVECCGLLNQCSLREGVDSCAE